MKKVFFICLLILIQNNLYAQYNFKKVIIVTLENTNYKNANAQPFIASLIKKGTLFTNFYAETHPSQGNYIAMTSGDLMGVKNDKNVYIDTKHIGDLLETEGLSWKVYAEGYPGNCFLENSGNYVRKHNPFISYKNIYENLDRCNNHIRNADELEIDIINNQVPNYSFYVPDLKNDGHDTGIAYADKWLQKKFGPILENPDIMKDMLFILTFDESGFSPKNQISTIFIGDSVKINYKSNLFYNHYSILKTLESAWNLGSLDKNDVSAKEILDAFIEI